MFCSVTAAALHIRENCVLSIVGVMCVLLHRCRGEMRKDAAAAAEGDELSTFYLSLSSW